MGHRKTCSIAVFGTSPTKEAVISASRTTKIAGIFLIPKVRASSRSVVMTSPTMARPFVSPATSLRTDAIRLHGPQV